MPYSRASARRSMPDPTKRREVIPAAAVAASGVHTGPAVPLMKIRHSKELARARAKRGAGLSAMKVYPQISRRLPSRGQKRGRPNGQPRGIQQGERVARCGTAHPTHEISHKASEHAPKEGATNA